MKRREMNNGWKQKVVEKIEIFGIICLISLGLLEGFLGFIGKTVEEVEIELLWALFTLNVTLIVLIAQKRKECAYIRRHCTRTADNNL